MSLILTNRGVIEGSTEATTFDITNGDFYPHREYKRSYHVESNQSISSELAIWASDLPQPYGFFYTSFGQIDVNARCLRVDAKPVENSHGMHHILTYTWSTKYDLKKLPTNGFATGNPTGGGGGGGQPNPQLEPPEIEWDFEETSIAMTKDLDGKVFKNSAEIPITGIRIPVYRSIFMLSRNELTWDWSKSQKIAGAVNKDIFWGYPPNCVLAMAPKAKEVFKDGLRYWRVTYKFKFGGSLNDENTVVEDFQHSELDAGDCELIKEIIPLGPLVTIKTRHRPFTEFGGQGRRVKLLNGEGQLQTARDANDQLIPVYLNFRIRRQINFSQFFTIPNYSGLPPANEFPP